jgi:1,4-alpha-glucan branching enzyme
MGSEFGQTKEWDYKGELQWELLSHNPHRLMQHCVRDLNLLYSKEPALHEKQFEPGGFEWVDLNHREECIIVYKRMGIDPKDDILVILNMLPQPRLDFEVTVKGKKSWEEVFNSDLTKYYGTGDVYNPKVRTNIIDKKEDILKLQLNLPPLGGIILK